MYSNNLKSNEMKKEKAPKKIKPIEPEVVTKDDDNPQPKPPPIK